MSTAHEEDYGFLLLLRDTWFLQLRTPAVIKYTYLVPTSQKGHVGLFRCNRNYSSLSLDFIKLWHWDKNVSTFRCSLFYLTFSVGMRYRNKDFVLIDIAPFPLHNSCFFSPIAHAVIWFSSVLFLCHYNLSCTRYYFLLIMFLKNCNIYRLP